MSVRSDHLFSKFTLSFGVVLAHWYALALIMGFQILGRGDVGWIFQLPVHSFGSEVWLGLSGGPVNADAYLLFFLAMVLVASIVFFMQFIYAFIRSHDAQHHSLATDLPQKTEPSGFDGVSSPSPEVTIAIPAASEADEHPASLHALLHGFRHHLNRL